ncbi:hypothetical protein CBS101457_004046 [Exobasidium rhododendri]|nr:hypothetical protein CBS101457_004046 [Exobasidium rhododendri]
MATMMATKVEDLGLAAFAPAGGSHPIQTPFGSVQLANPSQQQQHSMSFLGRAGNSGGADSDDEEEEDDDDDDEEGTSKGKRKRSKGGAGNKNGKKAVKGGSATGSGAASGERDMHTGRRKIRIEFIEDDSRRHITFSKRKAGIMKKAYELATLTGTQVLLLIVSQTGLVYTFTTPKLSPVVQESAGRELIQTCLNAPEPGEQSVLEAGNDSTEGDQSQGSSDQDELTNADFITGLASHAQVQAHNQQQPHHDPYAANPFHDPRNSMIANSHLGNLNLNIPHLQDLSYGNYSGHHMHEQSIPYTSFGF